METEERIFANCTVKGWFLNGCYDRFVRLTSSVLINESPAVVGKVCSYTTGETVLEIQSSKFSWVHKTFYFSKRTVGKKERIDFVRYLCLARIYVKNPILFDIPHKMAEMEICFLVLFSRWARVINCYFTLRLSTGRLLIVRGTYFPSKPRGIRDHKREL